MPRRRLCHVRAKSYTLNHRVVVHVCAEACWHTELILCADSILVTVAESSWDLFSPLSFSACFSFHSALMNWAIFCPRKNTSQRYNTVLSPDDSKRRLRNINQVTTWKTMSTWGLSPTKIACNPIICLGDSHMLTEWRPDEPVRYFCDCDTLLFCWLTKLSDQKMKRSNRSFCLTCFLFSALWGETAADLITAMP